jgi:hypothetical protein
VTRVELPGGEEAPGPPVVTTSTNGPPPGLSSEPPFDRPSQPRPKHPDDLVDPF